MGCFSAGPQDLGTVCTFLAFLTGLSPSLMAMMAASKASVTAYIIAYAMPCLAALPWYGFLETVLCMLPVSISWDILFYVISLAFYF